MSAAKECAGVLLCANDTGRCLFLLRTDGRWDIPGGHREHSDSGPLDTAFRELAEETGYQGVGTRASAVLRTCRLRDGSIVIGHHVLQTASVAVIYTAFVGYVEREYKPQLSVEHRAATWAHPPHAPDPLQRGTATVLQWAAALELL